MLTAGTYQKAHLFSDRQRLEGLTKGLYDYAQKAGYLLHAWAVFSNHYHAVLTVPQDAQALREFVQEFHSRSGRWLNQLDGVATRKVWHQYWDTRLSYERSFRARLHYVMTNPIKHGLVERAEDYPWCSAAAAAKHWQRVFYRSVTSFKVGALSVMDPF